jgi:ABC-type enterochelin transport system substrate-binding protein
VITSAQALALTAAEKGTLRRWNDDLDTPAAGKTYAPGLGTVAKPTIDTLMAAEPALLAVGERSARDVALVLTQAGTAALEAYRAPYRTHVGKGRR